MRKFSDVLIAQTAVLFFVAFAIPVIVSAHVLKEDNGTSAVLHIPPDDNPTAGEQVKLSISFRDKAKTFSLTKCKCEILIQKNGQTEQTAKIEPASSGAELVGFATATFEKPAAYRVILQGTSMSGAFESFKMSFPIRVSASSTSTSNRPSSEIIIIAAGSLIILAMFAYTSISYGGRYKKSNRVSRTTNNVKE